MFNIYYTNFWKANSWFSQAFICCFQLTVDYVFSLIARLAKPKITKSSITSLNNTCNITLTCSVEEEEKNVVYSWSPSGEESNVLQIFHSPMDQKLTYTCTASNPVSNNSDSVTVQQPCTGNELLSGKPQNSLWKALRFNLTFTCACLLYGETSPGCIFNQAASWGKTKAFFCEGLSIPRYFWGARLTLGFW